MALRAEVSALRKSERAAQTARSKESIRLGKARERTQKQKDTIKALRGEVDLLIRETRQQNRENGRLRRELEWSQGLKATVRRLTDEARLLRGGAGRDTTTRWTSSMRSPARPSICAWP